MDWDAAAAILDDAIADLFDTRTFTIMPTRQGLSVNHPRAEDPERESFDFAGLIEMPPPVGTSEVNAVRPDGRDSITWAAIVTARPQGWPYMPREHDRLADGQVTRTIRRITRDGSGRVALYLASS